MVRFQRRGTKKLWQPWCVTRRLGIWMLQKANGHHHRALPFGKTTVLRLLMTLESHRQRRVIYVDGEPLLHGKKKRCLGYAPSLPTCGLIRSKRHVLSLHDSAWPTALRARCRFWVWSKTVGSGKSAPLECWDLVVWLTTRPDPSRTVGRTKQQRVAIARAWPCARK